MGYLQQVLTLLYSGENHVLKLPAVKVSLLDPESTPLLNSVSLRNEAVQKFASSHCVHRQKILAAFLIRNWVLVN